MSVAQRRSEIGLRRAVGYGRLEIARLIVLEAAGVGMLGGIARRLDRGARDLRDRVGQPLDAGDEHHARARLSVPRHRRRVLAGGYPAIRAARITPMAALRS
jgi:putative ABC transport system permease protein